MTTTVHDLPQADLAQALDDITHDLKTWPAYFTPVWEARKLFEVRNDDRGYQTGDSLALSEWDPALDCDCRDTSRNHDRATCPRYTGRIITAVIGYALTTTPRRNNQSPGFDARGFIVLSLISTKRFEVPRTERVTPDMLTGPLSFPTPGFPRPARSAPIVLSREAIDRTTVPIPEGEHVIRAANCRLAETDAASNITCSTCQRANMAQAGAAPRVPDAPR